MTGETAQAIFAGANKEFPANPKAPVSEEVASWGSFKADTIRWKWPASVRPRPFV